jgi:hypothetical protein
MLTPTPMYSAVAKLWTQCKKGFKFLSVGFLKPAPVPTQVSAPGYESKRINNQKTKKREPTAQHDIMYLSNKLDGSSAARQNPTPCKPLETPRTRYHLLSPQ